MSSAMSSATSPAKQLMRRACGETCSPSYPPPFASNVDANPHQAPFDGRTPMTSSGAARYAAAVAAGRIERDQAQLAIVEKMAQLDARFSNGRVTDKSSVLAWLFASRERALAPLKGIYLYGDVGRGKTMLMDFFFESSSVVRKRRAHFHEFMLDVHERIYLIRDKMKFGEHADEDPI